MIQMRFGEWAAKVFLGREPASVTRARLLHSDGARQLDIAPFNAAARFKAAAELHAEGGNPEGEKLAWLQFIEAVGKLGALKKRETELIQSAGLTLKQGSLKKLEKDDLLKRINAAAGKLRQKQR